MVYLSLHRTSGGRLPGRSLPLPPQPHNHTRQYQGKQMQPLPPTHSPDLLPPHLLSDPHVPGDRAQVRASLNQAGRPRER